MRTIAFMTLLLLALPSAAGWVSTGTMAYRRIGGTQAGVLLPDGTSLFAASGIGSHTGGAATYSPQTGTWSETGPMICGGQAAVLLQDGTVLATGYPCHGFYFPSTDSWDQAGSSGTTYHSATALADGRVLIAGGSYGSVVYATTVIYDPTTGWGVGANMRQAREHHTATRLADDRVLVTGGAMGA